MPRFTILIPTFNNCETLNYSIPSVLAQDHTDFELFIVGDGCPERSRHIINTFCRQDHRIRFFDNPKGARHGELHRHAALQEASGQYVTYLSDDDLMLPQHLSTVLPYLERGYNFVHTLPVHVLPSTMREDERRIAVPGVIGQDIYLHPGSIEIAQSVERLLSGINFLSLSAVSHSLELYQSLPFGWRTTPEGVFTDLYMWQQFVAAAACKATGIYTATIIHCGKDLRAGWSLEQRVDEIQAWSELLTQPNLSHELTEATFSHCMTHIVGHQQAILDQIATNSRLRDELHQTQHTLKTTCDELQNVRCAYASTQAALTAVETSLAWRLAERIRRHPLLRGVCRQIAKSLFP